MNAPVRLQEFTEQQDKPGLLRKLLRALKTIFSSPKGDQGGWEGGARGL